MENESRRHYRDTCPVLQSFIASVKTAPVKTATHIAKQDILTRPLMVKEHYFRMCKTVMLDITYQTKITALYCIHTTFTWSIARCICAQQGNLYVHRWTKGSDIGGRYHQT